MLSLALNPTFIIYTYDLYIVKIYKSKINVVLFLKIYNGRKCILIFKIIIHEKQL